MYVSLYKNLYYSEQNNCKFGVILTMNTKAFVDITHNLKGSTNLGVNLITFDAYLQIQLAKRSVYYINHIAV